MSIPSPVGTDPTDHGTQRAGLDRASAGVLFAVLLVCVLAYLRHLAPLAGFPYELDPSDGDMLNAAHRWALGLPLYGDWHRGDIFLNYTPLFLVFLRVGSFLGLDPIVFFRHFNLALFVVHLVLLVRVAGQREDGGWNPIRGLLAGIVLLTAWRGYLWLMPIRPDMLAFFLSSLVCALLVLRPRSSGAIAVLGVLAVLSKQSALVIPVAATLVYWLWNRQQLRRYLLTVAVAAVLAVVYFEIQSQGHFLRSAFLYPPQALSGRFLRWHPVLSTAAMYYAQNLWLIPLVVAGWVAAFRSPLRPLALVFAIDLPVSIAITRNIAGSPTYLWFHFALAAILAAQGLVFLLRLAASRVSWLARPGVPAGLIVLVTVGWFVSDGVNLVTLKVPNTTKAENINAAHESAVREVAATHPGARWLVTRTSLAVVKTGAVLDQEYCTLAMATAHPKFLDPLPIQRRVARGEYQLAQVAPTGIASDPLTEVFRNCFRVLRQSTILFQTRTAPATILEYQGGSPECRRLQQ